MPAAKAASICVHAISPLVSKPISCGTPARSQRLPSSVQIVGLAQLPAILPRHAGRVLAVLAKAGIVHNPETARLSLLAQERHHFTRDRCQQCVIVPLGVRDQMMHRLVRRAHILRMHSCRHRLHTLALPWQHQPARYQRAGSARSACPSAATIFSV